MRSRSILAVAILGSLTVATAAYGLPWDVDMADSQAVKAYEVPMKLPPEGAVSQDNILTPQAYRANFDRMTPEGQALAAPFGPSEDALKTGARMYKVYCTPCHGDGVVLGPVAAPGRFPGVVPLAGAAPTVRSRTDGYLYLTIRNGATIMPAYGSTMTDPEIWSLVHFLRTLPNAAYQPPAPPPQPASPEPR